MLSRTPFLKLTEAYMKKRFTKEECQKSNRDIVRLIKYYDLKTKQFQFGSGDNCQITSRDMAEIFGLPNKGKKLPSTTTSTRMSLDFVKTYFTGAEKITKTTIDKYYMHFGLEKTTKNKKDKKKQLVLVDALS
ncbi:hypothetical protein L3X38_031773 [Prunus dulcis]|uniref:Uncharacterized protein n=1 Tax=Prunus dulcis TaxID=3755 RepID=A0AAD4YVA6_PRUDU|nr:hypothetical protein L3X38_031773 [Prunus dulcis]